VSKIALRMAVLGLAGLLALSGSAAQESQAGTAHAAGLIPLDSREIEKIFSDWPRITLVGLNRLGFDRINEVRSEKGKAPLARPLIKPIGGEVEGVLAGPSANAKPASLDMGLAADLPVNVDNSLLRYFPPIRDQGALGACVSFATTYTQLSYMTAFQRDLDIRDPGDNTNKYSPKWTYNMVNGGGDQGSTFTDCYDLLEKHGAATWAEFPYDADFRSWCLNPAAWRNALGVRTKARQYVADASKDTGLNLIKTLLTDGYVLTFGTYINSWHLKAISDDVSTVADDAAVGKGIGYWLSGSLGSHAMTIVGYNDAIWTDINANGLIDLGEKGAFRIANSWGAGWGEAGFIWLAYDALRPVSRVFDGPSDGRIGGFQGDLAFVLTSRDHYAPLMIAEITVSHSKRNQIGIELAMSDMSRTYPTIRWTPAAFQRQGGAYAFDGSTAAGSGTFVFDFSDILVASAGLQRYYLSLDDNTDGDPATLSAFKIVDLTTGPPTEVAYSLVPQTTDHATLYPYIEYSYTGPGGEHPPELSYQQIFPMTGRPGDLFRFDIHYLDPDGDVPSVRTVVIDGIPQTMILDSGGQPAHGVYHYEGPLSVGPHSSYFYFEDGRGGSARWPLAGTISGPNVCSHRIFSLSPGIATAGGPAFVLTVNGSDLPSGSVVTWDGSDRPTTFVSSSRVDAEIGAADLVPGRMVAVAVRDPAGGYGQPQLFEVSNPMPTLASFSPDGTAGGGSGLDLILHGSGFVSNSSVRWDGAYKTMTYVSAAELRVSLSALEVGPPGTYGVSVVNPPPAGGISSEMYFPVSDFALSESPKSLSALAGQSVSCRVQATPRNGPFDSAISFSCSGLPRGCLATFSPATLTPGASPASTTLTVVTTSRASALAAGSVGPGQYVPPALGLMLLLGLIIPRMIPVLCRRSIPLGPAHRRLATVVLILLTVWLAACGAGGGSDNQGTPAGTYQLAIQGRSGSFTSTTSLTLTIQ
jgi:hypothetical protein